MGTRYKEERTLVRPLRILPGETRKEYLVKVKRLKEHFKQFNIDAAELCQWMMGFGHKNTKPEFEAFWKFLIKTDEYFPSGTEAKTIDRARRRLFDHVFRMPDEEWRADDIPEEVISSAEAVADIPLTPTAEKLFLRLREMDFPRRQVLLKSACDWVYSRYLKGVESSDRRIQVWEEQKAKWEEKRPKLTNEVISEFNEIFETLKDEEGLTIRKKSPRVCTWEHLKEGKDDCWYTGQRTRGVRHSQLCVKYSEFLTEYTKKNDWFNEKNFRKDVSIYLDLARKLTKAKPAQVMEEFKKRSSRKAAQNFPRAWAEYKNKLQLNESTVASGLPHCMGLRNDCQFNRHTENCLKYREKLLGSPTLQSLDKLYREWRKEFLSPPKKPSFRYPSVKTLPMAKIFGDGYHEIDWDKSVLKMRPDDMPEGEWLEFAFEPWPKKYDVQPKTAEISSAQVTFVGNRPRVGFRFKVNHKESKFRVSQDEIDKLRSEKFPLKVQDNEFLEAGRKLLMDNFDGGMEKLRFIAVDIGPSGAAYGVFNAGKLEKSEPLNVVKINKLYPSPPKDDKKRDIFPREQGLRLKHFGKHLEKRDDKVEKIAEKRKATGKVELGKHDLRRDTVHINGMHRDWVRLNAKAIIDKAVENKADLIVFESLRDFKLPGHDKVDNPRKFEKRLEFAVLSPGKIRHKVKEKAVERGMRVMTVPEYKSSQRCSGCGEEQTNKGKLKDNKINKHKFSCEYEGCKNKDIDSDENAARVLGRLFLGEIEPLEES